MNEAKLHTYSAAGTILCVVGVAAVVYVSDSARKASAAPDPFANMTVIDAALAEQSSAETKQPQKETREPPPPVKPIGVSHDENAKPVTTPEPPKPPPPPDNVNIDDVLKKHRTDDDDDLPVATKPKIETGRIDGVDIGYGDKTFGNPYLGALKSGFMRGWEYPEILSDVGTPIGCIQLDADGKIADTKLITPSGNAELDDSVERALTAFQKKVNDDPKPLPTGPGPDNDLSYLARMMLCWRLKV
ncbi:MAG TPA: TonB C-terminal domain-containing protein [Kofleriaceae bacterium]|nr:TonB C-terminal domain-containing protein [Kofleriaceae bacterium]